MHHDRPAGARGRPLGVKPKSTASDAASNKPLLPHVEPCLARSLQRLLQGWRTASRKGFMS
ncbi:hypothetical protein SERLA73DRAFT_146263 [Serpula lacrymans var. lacrymans S7.3]|uniref:Uncharacterized protein n=2 Tax=Serpula lacrymans var. lacrymans TaxID=341189 RepID=F8QFB7_SERL3|nr:hypothetical protein SERLA73DRAFT_146263 [Serpula lacrymans var. lacrymans S7.3]